MIYLGCFGSCLSCALPTLTRSLLFSGGLKELTQTEANFDWISQVFTVQVLYFWVNIPPSSCPSLSALVILHRNVSAPVFAGPNQPYLHLSCFPPDFYLIHSDYRNVEGEYSQLYFCLVLEFLHSWTNKAQVVSHGNGCVCKLTGRKMMVICRLGMQGGECCACLSREELFLLSALGDDQEMWRFSPFFFFFFPGGCVINKGTFVAKGCGKFIFTALKKLRNSQICNISALLGYFIPSGLLHIPKVLPERSLPSFLLLISSSICQAVCGGKGCLWTLVGSWSREVMMAADTLNTTEPMRNNPLRGSPTNSQRNFSALVTTFLLRGEDF